MGFLSNLLGGAGGTRDPYPHAMMLTCDGEQVARVFLQNLEVVLEADRNYSKFFDIITGPQGISTMKMWYKRFTQEKLRGHNLAVWLEQCATASFEPMGVKVLTDAGLTKLCKKVQNLL